MSDAILPEQTEQALRRMIEITNEVTSIMENESNAVAMNDAVAFSVNEQDKSQAASRYEQAAKEFHLRVEEFRGADTALIDALEAAQHRLGDVTRQNNNVLSKIPGVEGDE